MGTPYSEINELFLSGIQDYKIDRLFQSSTPSLVDDYILPFMTRGLINFKKCKKDLSNRDNMNKMFNITLDDEEKVILSNLMIVEWLNREVNDILQMKLHLNDTDFKLHSAAQNLKEKREHLYGLNELVHKQITQYGYNNLDWSTLR
jgi:hypothetical protein